MVAFPNSRAGAVKPGVPLMIVSVLAVAGFLYWLSITAVPTEEMVVEADESDAAANQVTLRAFSDDIDGFVGQEITLADLQVTSLLGPHAFWTSLADTLRTAYLVHLDAMLIADSVGVASGTMVTVTGMVEMMSDSVLADWEAAGAFPTETDRFVAESGFHPHFLEVSAIEQPEAEEPGPGEAS